MVRRLRESMDPRNLLTLASLDHLLDLLPIGFRSMQISVWMDGRLRDPAERLSLELNHEYG